MSTIKENLSNNMSAPTNSTPTTPIDALSSPLVLPNDISEKNFIKPPSKIWDHFAKVKWCDLDHLRATCNYYEIDYECHNKRNRTSNMKAHLASRCKKYPFRYEDPKQKT